jgi:peptide/nickel transport system substrate-binding protein
MKPQMTRRRLRVVLVLLAIAGVLATGFGDTRAVASLLHGRDGGTFNVTFMTTGVDYVDPALSYTGNGWALLDATCARLMNYPDKAPPEGLRVVPEVAAVYPRISSDAKTYTFTLRRGFRFSDGTPVQASAFARAINRTLAPGVESAGAQYTRDIVGAGAVRAGKSAAATGVVANGNRLVVRFTRPVADFPAQTTMPFFCAVPPTLPSDPEGVGAFPGAGPYYISEYVRGRRVVLERNRFYRGSRPHHVDRFVVDLGARTPEEVLDRIEAGAADWGLAPPPIYFDEDRGLARKYGVNRSQFFVKPGLVLRGYLLNTSRPLFRNNAKLRRAVNFALDRPAIVGRGGTASLSGLPTDQYMPPSMPGFKDEHIYPVSGPVLQTARALARGNTRSGKAVLYTIDVPPELVPAQIVQRNLRRIGLDVEIKALSPQAYFSRLGRLPFDIAWITWLADYVDPFQFANLLFDGRFIGGTNYSRLNSRRYNDLMRRAARLQGDARYRAYGRLDVQLARDAAPMAAVAYDNQATLVSKRVGCIVLRPTLDLTAACLK